MNSKLINNNYYSKGIKNGNKGKVLLLPFHRRNHSKLTYPSVGCSFKRELTRNTDTPKARPTTTEKIINNICLDDSLMTNCQLLLPISQSYIILSRV